MHRIVFVDLVVEVAERAGLKAGEHICGLALDSCERADTNNQAVLNPG